MSDFKKQLSLQTVILLSIVVVLGSGVFFLRSSIVRNVSVIVEAKSETSLRQLTLQALSGLKKEAGEASALLPSLKLRLPSRDDLFTFSKNLGAIAANRKVQFGFSFAPEIHGGEASASYVPFEITSGGDFGNLINFLSDLENSNYIVQISSVDLAAGSTKIVGRVYYK